MRRSHLSAVSGTVIALFLMACQSARVDGRDGGASADSSNAQSGGPPGLSLPDAGEAGPAMSPTCAGEAHRAQQSAMDLLLLVDTSGSMTESAGTRTKWELIRQALHQFLVDPRSAGLSVGLQFFPLAPDMACQTDGDCGPLGSCKHRGVCVPPGASAAAVTPCTGFMNTCSGGQVCRPLHACARSGLPCLELDKPCGDDTADRCQARPGSCRLRPGGGPIGCDRDAYTALAAPVSPLPTWAGAVSLAIAAVEPVGDTPMTAAVEGAFVALRAHASARPERRAGLVLATDGLPTGCSPNDVDTVSAALMAARTGSPALTTHVIGVFPPAEVAVSRPALERLAAAGGTGEPFVLTARDDLADRFLSALAQIRGQALACEFPIPRPTASVLDYGKVNVRFTGMAGLEELVFVDSADRCHPDRGGWYYDVNPQLGVPSRVVVCEATCRRIRLEANGVVEVNVGCTTRID